MMASLTGDIRVWSLREDVVVRDADFSAVRYVACYQYYDT